MNTETTTGRLPEGPTGRQIITFAQVDPGTATREMRDVAGLDLSNARDVGAPGEASGGGVYLETLNIAIVDSAPDQLGALSRAVDDSASPIIAVEPEVYVHAFDTIEATDTYAGVETDESTQDDEVDAAETYADTATYTWGLKAVRAIPPILYLAPWSGTGIKIAVLDTGIDLGHPDFAGRVLASQSFIPGEAVHDGHSHGTHCAGTAAGIKVPPAASAATAWRTARACSSARCSPTRAAARRPDPGGHRLGDPAGRARDLDVARLSVELGEHYPDYETARRGPERGGAHRGRRGQRRRPLRVTVGRRPTAPRCWPWPRSTRRSRASFSCVG